MNRRTIDHFKACMLGGAIGYAMGAPIEFVSIYQIRSALGHHGVTGYSKAYGRICAFTDDLQMTLFTADGLILSKLRQEYQICILQQYLHRYQTKWKEYSHPLGWL